MDARSFISLALHRQLALLTSIALGWRLACLLRFLLSYRAPRAAAARAARYRTLPLCASFLLLPRRRLARSRRWPLYARALNMPRYASADVVANDERYGERRHGGGA